MNLKCSYKETFIYSSFHPSINFRFIQFSIHPLFNSFIHPYIHPYIRLFVHSFIHSFIHSFVHSFIHSVISFIYFNSSHRISYHLIHIISFQPFSPSVRQSVDWSDTTLYLRCFFKKGDFSDSPNTVYTQGDMKTFPFHEKFFGMITM